MRFELVKAHAFGPFQNETLELAPGMNVVYGLNEAGKSSWRAALYAGLCGARRGKGGLRTADREFAERHKPWDGGAWEVGAVVALDDGRVVELRHDLAGRVVSSARDVNRAGRDYSGDIINDGAPDGSIWLKLNRQTFLSVACVGQADVLGILSNSEMLQEDMQRAAATAGRGETAAGALSILDSYHKEAVGSNLARTKPLVQSQTRVRQADAAVRGAREARDSYLQRRADADRREQDLQDARRKTDMVEAALMKGEAVQAERRLELAEELANEFPEGAPRPSPERDEVAERVTAALTTWEQRPELIEPEGDTTEEHGRRIAEAAAWLGAAKAAAAERAAADAGQRLERARELIAKFPDGQPPRPSAADQEMELQASLALQEWEPWASRPLPGQPVGASVEEIEQELAEFEANAAPPPPSPRTPPLAAAFGGLAGAAGIIIAAFLPDFRVIGIVLAALGIAGAVGALRWQAAAQSREQARAAREQVVLNVTRNGIIQRLEARRKEENDHRAETERRSDALNRLEDAASACGDAATEPAEQAKGLRDWLAVRRETMRKNDELGALWDELQQRLGGSSLEEVAMEAERLQRDATALIGSVDAALLSEARKRNLAGERLADLERETQENRIARERARAERESADEQYAADVKAVTAAEDALRNAAVAAQVEAEDADGRAKALREWQERRKRSVAEAEERSRRWDKLQQLLGENSLEEVAAEAERLRADANERAAKVGASALAQAKSDAPSPDLLESLQSSAKRAEDAWNVERGQLEELEKSLPSVADAEDELAEAKREQEHVRRLDETLKTTMRFLEAAQEKVHNDIAPALRSTVLERLSQVTAGRYTDCQIDPANLKVEVAGASGRWRDAALLSHGTAEQVYLLLRLALARHLTADSGEACPLILDDAVGASDGERKLAALDALLAISESTQVILFTHEDDVRDWARERLVGPTRRLLELDPSGVPA